MTKDQIQLLFQIISAISAFLVAIIGTLALIIFNGFQDNLNDLNDNVYELNNKFAVYIEKQSTQIKWNERTQEELKQFKKLIIDLDSRLRTIEHK